MSYLSLIIAAIQMRNSSLTGNAWFDGFLNNLVGVETWFYHASWVIWGIAVFLGIVAMIWLGKDAVMEMGCFVIGIAVVLLLLPLFEYITMNLAMGMASAVTPEGVVNQGQLIVNGLLYLLIGTG